jgi:autotransporter-associated beta strand protein
VPNGSGDFLTYGSAGFSKATYTQATSTAINSATATTVYEANVSQTVTTGTTAHVYALKVGASTIDGGALKVGSQVSGDQAGVILNGGTIATTNLNFGAAEGVVYTSQAGGTISAVVKGSGGLTTFGPGTLTLTAANTYTGSTQINSGTLLAANTTGSATGSGDVTVFSTATLQVTGQVGVNGSTPSTTTVNSGGTLLLSGGTVNGTLTMASGSHLFGTGTVADTATVSGIIGNSATDPSAAPFTGVNNVTFSGSSTTFNSSTIYAWRLNVLDDTPANAGVNWSLLHFTTQTGTIYMGTSNSHFNFTLDLGANVPDPNSGNAFWGQSHSWLVAQAPYAFNSIYWYSAFPTYDQGYFSLSVDAQLVNVYVSYTPTPEPTWIMGAALAGLAAALRWWRSK